MRGIAASALVLLMLSAGLSPAQADEIVERVMAVVSGDIIMLSDVRAARDLALVDTDAGQDGDAAILAKLVDRSLVLAEVDRYAPPEPTTAAVDAAMRTIRDRFGSDAQLTAVLARNGFDANHLRQLLREDLRIRAYLDQRFAAEDPDRRRIAIGDWVAGLRRRADIIQAP